MSLSQFLSSKKTILLDGAMGTQLAEAGLEMGGQNCITHPDAVLAVHRQYVECGVDLLITNTLTMNRLYIEKQNMGINVREVNLAGARLAKSAARQGQYVLGDMSTTGQLLKPYGDLAEADAYEAFKEQAEILAEGGVDGYIIETMFSMKEAQCALRACRDVAPLPVIVSMAFKTAAKGGRTEMGDSAKACAQAFQDGGASVVGANCGDLSPSEMAEVVSAFCSATSLPVAAQPNAGKPRLAGNQTVFDMGPAEFAEGVSKCLQAGARLVGGCCGTSPAHLRAVASVVGARRVETV